MTLGIIIARNLFIISIVIVVVVELWLLGKYYLTTKILRTVNSEAAKS